MTKFKNFIIYLYNYFFFYYDYLGNLLSVSLITGFSSFLVYYILFIHFYFGLIY